MDYATPAANVSAFCRSVLSTLIPNDFWGEGDTQTHNKGLFMKSVDRFIIMRRFETVSLHNVIQGMKVSNTNCAVGFASSASSIKIQLTPRRSRTSVGLVHKIMSALECRNQIRGSV
jgi:Telomerase ribonucleoprotein complex - RNA binding domain